MSLEKSQQQATLWVNEYGDMLYGFALQRIKDKDIAKDLVQDTFLAAWRNINNYTGEASVKTWLFTILKNKLIDHYRKTASTVTASFNDQPDEDFYFDAAEHWAISAYPKEWTVQGSRHLESKEFYTILEKCKSKLKQIQATVFSMKYLDGFESEEICKALDISSSNYWILIHRAKLQLRACLETNWLLH